MEKKHLKQILFSIIFVYLTVVQFSCSNSDANITDETLGGNDAPVSFKLLNYKTFSSTRLAFGTGLSQSKTANFILNQDNTNVKAIKMFVKLECPSGGCNIWDVYANVAVKDKTTQKWFEIGRFITPYGVDTSQLQRGIEIDVTDFKSLLQGQTELKVFIETWGDDGWNISVEFDYQEGIPDFPYYGVAEVLAYNDWSLGGVPYGSSTSGFDLTKTIDIPRNAMSTHLRTIISGWGHATPADADGRGCAEWCFRTHRILINNESVFTHELKPIG